MYIVIYLFTNIYTVYIQATHHCFIIEEIVFIEGIA